MRLILGKNHSGLSEGQAYVYGAGEFHIDKNGNVLRINNLSGHYLPTEENLWKSYNLLINKGFITRDVQVTPVDF